MLFFLFFLLPANLFFLLSNFYNMIVRLDGSIFWQNEFLCPDWQIALLYKTSICKKLARASGGCRTHKPTMMNTGAEKTNF